MKKTNKKIRILSDVENSALANSLAAEAQALVVAANAAAQIAFPIDVSVALSRELRLRVEAALTWRLAAKHTKQPLSRVWRIEQSIAQAERAVGSLTEFCESLKRGIADARKKLTPRKEEIAP